MTEARQSVDHKSGTIKGKETISLSAIEEIQKCKVIMHQLHHKVSHQVPFGVHIATLFASLENSTCHFTTATATPLTLTYATLITYYDTSLPSHTKLAVTTVSLTPKKHVSR